MSVERIALHGQHKALLVAAPLRHTQHLTLHREDLIGVSGGPLPLMGPVHVQRTPRQRRQQHGGGTPVSATHLIERLQLPAGDHQTPI